MRTTATSARARTRLALAGVPALVTVFALFIGACGGSDPNAALNDIVAEPGRVSCEAFGVLDSYAYTTTVTLELEERPEGVEPGGGDTYRTEGFAFTQIVDGMVQGLEKIQIHTTYPPPQDQYGDFVLISGTLYFSLLGEPWQAKPLAESGYNIPYIPSQGCNALAPDIFLDQLEGTPENVGDIQAAKYHFENLPSDMPDHHPSFGPGSDAARYVNQFTGDVWVAEDGKYIAGMDIYGRGTYENGRGVSVKMSYELSRVNDGSIDIKAPIEPPPPATATATP